VTAAEGIQKTEYWKGGERVGSSEQNVLGKRRAEETREKTLLNKTDLNCRIMRSARKANMDRARRGFHREGGHERGAWARI